MVGSCTSRDFEPRDLPRLQEIREEAFRPIFRSFRQIVGEAIAKVAFAAAEQEQSDLLDRYCEEGSSRDVFVIECGSEIVGFCTLTVDQATKVGEIDLNAVHPDFQGRGIGTWMYKTALDRMRSAGMRVATVGTGGDPSHALARRAYDKAGFGPAIPSIYLYRSL